MCARASSLIDKLAEKSINRSETWAFMNDMDQYGIFAVIIIAL